MILAVLYLSVFVNFIKRFYRNELLTVLTTWPLLTGLLLFLLSTCVCVNGLLSLVNILRRGLWLAVTKRLLPAYWTASTCLLDSFYLPWLCSQGRAVTACTYFIAAVLACMMGCKLLLLPTHSGLARCTTPVVSSLTLVTGGRLTHCCTHVTYLSSALERVCKEPLIRGVQV